jgi:hypothetical protein
VRWLAWLLIAACSSAPGPDHPRPAPSERGTAPRTAPSEQDCDALITHAVALGIDEQAGRTPPPRTTASDHEAIRRALHDEFVAGCRALPLDAYRCAMAATTLDALAGCQPRPSEARKLGPPNQESRGPGPAESGIGGI